jgi:hypothetical protein
MKYPNGRFHPKPCRTCQTEFTPEAPSHLYCSIPCRGNNSYYRRNYGITQADYERMKKAQGYLCHLCGGEGFLMDSKRHHQTLCVDHDHDTGKVRKLLCHNCNRALGLLKDDPSLMRKAAEYIEQHK